MAGLDSPTTYAPAGDPVLASLHQNLLSDANPLRLASASTLATTDFTPGPQGTDTVSRAPAAPLSDASLTPGTPPPATTEVASAAPPPVPADLVPPTPKATPAATPGDAGTAATAAAPGGPVRLAQSDSTPAPGSAPAPASTFSYSDAGSACDDKTICSWKPNPNSTSQLTKDWFAAHQTQAATSVDCNYKVKFGDDLEGIAKRELKAEGKEGASVKDEVAKIISLNHDHYKSLDCNKDFIRTGWTLKLDDKCAVPPPQADATPPPAPAPISAPDTSCKVDAPCGADVIVDNPNGKIIYNGKQVGDHDRAIVTNGKAVEVPIPGTTPAAAPQRVGDATGPAVLPKAGDAPAPTPGTVATGDAPTPPPAVAPKPVETAAAGQPDTPAPITAPKIESVAAVPAPDTPAPIIVARTPALPAPDAPAPVTPPPDTSSEALTPGPDEVQATVAPVGAPPPRRVAAASPPATPGAAPDAPKTTSAQAGGGAVPLDGNDLSPG